MVLFRKKYPYEAFLSHAVEDRNVIATELYERLDEAGVNIWYSGKSLKTGEELEREIEQAIDNCRFGVVVLTRLSIVRPWPLTEYNWLRKKEGKGTKVILPVVHDMAFEEITWPGVVSKYCIHSSRGMDFVVEKILEEITAYRESERIKRRLERWLISSMLVILSLLIAAIIYWNITDRPTHRQINDTINSRVQKLMNTVGNKYLAPFRLQSKLAGQSKIDSSRLAFENYKSYYRNEYEFNNDISLTRGRRNVESVLGINLVDLANSPGYGMDSLDIYWSTPTIAEGFRHSSFSIVNKRPLIYSLKKEKQGSSYLVTVAYQNNIQYINVSLTTPPLSTGTKRHEMTLCGLPPSETYFFEKGPDGEWYFTKVE